MAYAYDPGTRFALGPTGYWTPVSSGGRPLSDFVSVSGSNGQGSWFIPREELPSDWTSGMSLRQNPDGSFSAVPYSNNPVSPYSYWDYSTNTGVGPLEGPGTQTPTQPGTTEPGTTQPGGLLTPGGSTGNNGGLPGSTPVTQPPATTPGGSTGLPVSQPGTTGPVSTPNLPPIGAGTAREELERLRLAGLLDNLSITPYQGVRAPDYGNGPGQPMTHNPMAAALYGYRQNDYWGTWDPTQLRGGSNPYYNPPSMSGGLLPPPSQGPIVIGPNGLLG